jgi:predicted metal-binding protein
MEFENYIHRAIELGAGQARLIEPSQVVTADWVRLKCQYGCGAYGSNLTCPPYSPTPAYTQRMLGEYASGLLVTFRVNSEEEEYDVRRQVKRIVADLERELFLDGYYSAFGMSCGPCNLCEECDVTRPCKLPHLARPSMEACGIDVYATLRNVGLKLNVVTSRQQPCTLCGLIFIGPCHRREMG